MQFWIGTAHFMDFYKTCLYKTVYFTADNIHSNILEAITEHDIQAYQSKHSVHWEV